MNKFIKQELDKVKISLPPYNEETLTLVIPKQTSPQFTADDLQVGGVYVIHIEDYIINEPANFTLSANWNKGTKPDDNRLYAQIASINGKMIGVKTKGVNTNTLWAGWLPRKSITILEDMNDRK